MADESQSLDAVVDEHERIIVDLPCRRCGARLRGLPRSANCPACGSPAAISIPLPRRAVVAAPAPPPVQIHLSCRRCGLDLHGSMQTGECPRCGLPVGDSLPGGALSPTNESGVVVCDLACRHCRYNLRGLHERGRCPECGELVQRSTKGNLLSDADPSWVEGLVKGCSYILAGAAIVFVGASLALVMVGAGTGRGEAALISPEGAELLGVGSVLIGQLLVYAGLWVVTKPDPDVAEKGQMLTARWLVRTMVCALFLALILRHSASALALSWFSRRIVMLLAEGLKVTTVVGTAAYWSYVRHLARRIPHESYARRARYLSWGFAAPLTLLSVFGLTMQTANALNRPMPRLPGLGPFALGAFVALLVVAIVGLWLQYRLRTAFRQQAQFAHEHWWQVAGQAGAGDRKQPADDTSQSPSEPRPLP